VDVTLPVYTGDRQRNLMIYVGCAYRLVIHPQLVVIHQNGAMHSQSVFDVCMHRVVWERRPCLYACRFGRQLASTLRLCKHRACDSQHTDWRVLFMSECRATSQL